MRHADFSRMLDRHVVSEDFCVSLATISLRLIATRVSLLDRKEAPWRRSSALRIEKRTG
jgi:hypothetical protein